MSAWTRFEGPTWAALIACYSAFAALTFYADATPFTYLALAFVIAFFLSLRHEALHGHPTRWCLVNEALVFPPLDFAYPYGRFRDTHLAHHRDSRLTDPYDDPESWYVDPTTWDTMPAWFRRLLTMNNCALGRMTIGPGLGFLRFVMSDIRLMRSGRWDVTRAWALHALGAVPLVWWLAQMPISVPAYALSCYGALSLISLRSFLEHRAEERVAGRTAIVEDKGPFALLYLNNNLHAVHHAHPDLPWYDLPGKYRANKERYLAMNGGYFFPSYWQVLTRHGLHPKEPAPHPMMHALGRGTAPGGRAAK